MGKYTNDYDRMIAEINAILAEEDNRECYEDIFWANVPSTLEHCSGSTTYLLSDEWSPDDEW